MVNIIVQLSKYLMILMITVYTYLCFSIFGYYDPDKKKRCLRKQNVLMFVMHLTAFLVMYLEKKDTKILALYLMQVTLLGGTILLYSFIYPKVSRLVVNNMCMLLSIGFIMITRLNYDTVSDRSSRNCALPCDTDHYPKSTFSVGMENSLRNYRYRVAGGSSGCR